MTAIREVRMRGKPEKGKPERSAEEKGRAAAAALDAVIAAERDADIAAEFWPEGKELPTYHRRRQVLPCPKCRRVFLPSSRAQAVECQRSGVPGAASYFRCKACENRWALPAREA